MNTRWIALMVAIMLSSSMAPAADAPEGCLNVKDVGASGSEFETVASTTAGSKQITVKEVGDFQVGQGVMVSKSNPHAALRKIWGPRHNTRWCQDMGDQAEIRGYNGDQGDWIVLMLDVPAKSNTNAFTSS